MNTTYEHKKRILIIGEDRRMVTSIRMSLQLGGYSVEVAGSPREGLEVVGGTLQFDLVIFDADTPSGVLPQSFAQIGAPVIVLSAYAGWFRCSGWKGWNGNRLQVLRKPFGNDELLEKIEKSLKKSDTRRHFGCLRNNNTHN